MKKYLILLLLGIPAVAYSWGLMGQMGGAGGGGGEPATYTMEEDETYTLAFPSNRMIGQTFSIPTDQGGPVTSINLNIYAVGTSGDITCRMGVADGQTDMSDGQSYESGTVAVSATGGTGDINLSGSITVAVGETFAFACKTDGELTVFRDDDTETWVGDYYWTTSPPDWQLSGHADVDFDFNFKYSIN